MVHESDIPYLNPPAGISNLAQLSCCSSSFSCMGDYQAVDNGGYCSKKWFPEKLDGVHQLKWEMLSVLF